MYLYIFIDSPFCGLKHRETDSIKQRVSNHYPQTFRHSRVASAEQPFWKTAVYGNYSSAIEVTPITEGDFKAAFQVLTVNSEKRLFFYTVYDVQNISLEDFDVGFKYSANVTRIEKCFVRRKLML